MRQKDRLRLWLLQLAKGRLWRKLEPKPSNPQETFPGLTKLSIRLIGAEDVDHKSLSGANGWLQRLLQTLLWRQVPLYQINLQGGRQSQG